MVRVGKPLNNLIEFCCSKVTGSNQHFLLFLFKEKIWERIRGGLRKKCLTPRWTHELSGGEVKQEMKGEDKH